MRGGKRAGAGRTRKWTPEERKLRLTIFRRVQRGFKGKRYTLKQAETDFARALARLNSLTPTEDEETLTGEIDALYDRVQELEGQIAAEWKKPRDKQRRLALLNEQERAIDAFDKAIESAQPHELSLDAMREQTDEAGHHYSPRDNVEALRASEKAGEIGLAKVPGNRKTFRVAPRKD